MRKRLSIILLMLLMVTITSELCAASFFAQLMRDRRAHKEGDLVTIIVVEQAEATQTAATQTGKKGSVGVGPGLGLLDFIPLIRASGDDDMSSKGTTSRGSSLQTKITAQISEKLPNGNFVIEGTHSFVLNGEKQEISIKGVVRPDDIDGDNEVLSSHIADAEITYQGFGVVGDKQQPGILTRLFQWLF
ncbi:MAG: flagellar basal body L-ring protein FlgH [Limnochordia bacterium]|nr:flagellar basal body L-ring protein FlgH [Limnochordia bacterium]